MLAFRGLETIRAKIVLNGRMIEQINAFNYLGCNISYARKEDFTNKINKFNYFCGVIKRTLKYTSKETRLKFYKVMLLYGSEFWTLTKSEEKRIEVIEMRFLRSIAGYTLLDKKRNEDIRLELNIFNLIEKLTEYRNKWKQHVERMTQDRIPKLIFDYRPTGKRNIGRPGKDGFNNFKIYILHETGTNQTRLKPCD